MYNRTPSFWRASRRRSGSGEASQQRITVGGHSGGVTAVLGATEVASEPTKSSKGRVHITPGESGQSRVQVVDGGGQAAARADGA